MRFFGGEGWICRVLSNGFMWVMDVLICFMNEVGGWVEEDVVWKDMRFFNDFVRIYLFKSICLVLVL